MAVVLHNEDVEGAKSISTTKQHPGIPNIKLNTTSLGALSPECYGNLALTFGKVQAEAEGSEDPAGDQAARLHFGKHVFGEGLALQQRNIINIRGVTEIEVLGFRRLIFHSKVGAEHALTAELIDVLWDDLLVDTVQSLHGVACARG